MLYIIGIILCCTYALPKSVLALCIIGAIIKVYQATCSFFKGFYKAITKDDEAP